VKVVWTSILSLLNSIGSITKKLKWQGDTRCDKMMGVEAWSVELTCTIRA
jgi:hypothetical protein